MSNSRGGAGSPPSFLSPPYQAIRWTPRDFAILDQRLLPGKKKYLNLPDVASACDAIKTLAVRGAPLIGVAAALAVAHAARNKATYRELKAGIQALSRTRPTAVNLFAALDRMRKVVEGGLGVSEILKEGLAVWKEEEERSFKMAAHGGKLLRRGMKVATYCNTGALAAPGLGTALGVIIKAHLDGKKVEVFVSETRPLLQGSRLTAWELSQWAVPYTLVTESALASVLEGLDAIFAGADRIAANGDTANKVGTHGLAIIAHRFNVPFYVVAPSTTIDMSLPDGSQIPIEQRGAEEVRRFGNCISAPRSARVFNPAFDVTPAGLIAGIITETGVLSVPYNRSIAGCAG